LRITVSQPSSKPDRLRVRRARRSDAARLAELSGQLGYPTTTREMQERLRRVAPASQHAILVAEASGKIVGLLHVSATPLLEVPFRAEVNCLIVDERVRSRGAGARLLQHAENWARKRGCVSMSVRSNVLRERAHHFYLRNGYEHYKTQKAFRKAL